MGRPLGWERVRRVVRLVGELHEIGAGEEARRHLLEGLRDMLGVAIGGVVLDEEYRPGGKGGVGGATMIGFDESTIRVAHATRTPMNPCYLHMKTRGSTTAEGEVITATHDEIVSSRQWRRSVFINEFARPAGFDHFLCSARMVGFQRAESIGLMRQARDRPFTEEDRDVVRLVQLEAPRSFPRSPVPLAPRVRQTLECLLVGASDKEIAQHLGLSAHTVRDYVKAIFRAYGVHSRPQLIASVRRCRLR